MIDGVSNFSSRIQDVKSSKPLKKDHYDKLPSMACEVLDRLITKYSKEPWFNKAWNEYRAYVFKTSINNLRMPGFIFNKHAKGVTPKNDGTGPQIIKHHGIKGQKWGVRRFQTEDGSLINPKRKARTDVDKKAIAKKVTIGLGMATIVAGTAYLASKHGKTIRAKQASDFIAQSKKTMLIRQRTMKAQQTRQVRKAAGYYKNYKSGMNYSNMPKYTAGKTFTQQAKYMSTPISKLSPPRLRI